MVDLAAKSRDTQGADQYAGGEQTDEPSSGRTAKGAPLFQTTVRRGVPRVRLWVSE